MYREWLKTTHISISTSIPCNMLLGLEMMPCFNDDYTIESYATRIGFIFVEITIYP